MPPPGYGNALLNFTWMCHESNFFLNVKFVFFFYFLKRYFLKGKDAYLLNLSRKKIIWHQIPNHRQILLRYYEDIILFVQKINVMNYEEFL